MSKTKNKLKPIDAPVYSYWEALYKSFYSMRLYVDVGKRWRGIGVLYLLLTIAIFSIPFSIKVAINLNQSFNEQIIEPLLLLPTIYVQDGELKFDKPMPYLIKNEKNQVVLIIDSTGKVDKFSSEYPYMNILINKDKVSFRIPTPQLFSSTTATVDSGVPLTQSFGKGATFAFSGKKIVEENSMYGLKYASLALIYPVIVAMFYSMFVVMFLVFAFLGQVFSRTFFSFQVTFKQSCRIFMMATTPMLLALILILTADAIFPGFGFILVGVVAIYFSLGVSALKAESKRMVRE